MPNRTPAEVFPPGEFIHEELEARGWTERDLARIMDMPLGLINELVTGTKRSRPKQRAVSQAHLATAIRIIG
jgi:HTH-type transcriptional regulator / antitoxin HigA